MISFASAAFVMTNTAPAAERSSVWALLLAGNIVPIANTAAKRIRIVLTISSSLFDNLRERGTIGDDRLSCGSPPPAAERAQMGAVSWEKVSSACKESRAYVASFWSDPPPKSKATGQDIETKPWKRRGVSRSGSVFLVTMSLALIVLLLVSVQALASCVGCDLESVSTQLHAAP